MVDKKQKRRVIYMDDFAWKLISLNAKDSGLTISAYIRYRMSHSDMPPELGDNRTLSPYGREVTNRREFEAILDRQAARPFTPVPKPTRKKG